MLEFVKKTVYAGVGLAFLTRNKAEELAKTMMEEGKMSGQEGEKWVKELMMRSEEAKNLLEEKVRGLIETTLQKMHVPTREELKRLEARIEKLESSPPVA